MNIFIACGLTQIPRNLFATYTETIHTVAARLSSKGLHQVKYALLDIDPRLASEPRTERAPLCYSWGKSMVEAADLVLAEASFPSIGLGIEMQIAAASEKPLIIFYRDFGVNKLSSVTYENPDKSLHELHIDQGFVSLMALGIPTVQTLIKYSDTADAALQLAEAVRLRN
jgi:hypothetical protein